MKVESRNDVQTVQSSDQPVINTGSVPAPAKGVDELAHLFNQEVELNKLPLAHRQMGVRVPAAEKLAELYDQLGHPAQASMAAVSRRLRMHLLQSASVEKLLDIAGGDPARAFVVLKHLANEADTEIRKSEAALARSAIAKLEARFKGQIQAGLNIAVALQAACADAEERQALRALYYASVVTRQSLATMMQALLGVYGGDRFQDGLTVMRKALADDIAALVSSMPTPMLRTLLVGLRSCGQLSAVLAGCVACKQRLCMEDEAVTLLQRLLGYAGGGIASAEALRLASELGGGPTQQQLVCLNALYPLFQQLPLAVWPDSRARQEALHVLLVVLDELHRTTRPAARFISEPRGTA